MPSRATMGNPCLTQVYETPTTVGGLWTFTTTTISTERFIRQIVVRATNPATTFNFKITDANGVMIRQFNLATGVINDVTPTPVTGNFTIDIDTSVPDDTYEVMIKLCST